MQHSETTTLRAHQIQEGLEGFSEIGVAQTGVSQDEARKTLSHLSEVLKSSQKFLLTDNIPFPEPGEKFELIPEAANLPADYCYFERSQKNAGTWGAICFNHGDRILGREATGLKPKWTCFLFLKKGRLDPWVLSPCASVVCLNETQEIKLVSTNLFSPAGEMVEHEAISGLTRAAASEIMYFLQMLSCSNVTMRTIEKPKALNKKRALKNLPALDEYHVLKLPMHVAPQHEPHEWGGNSKNSPRAHFRRGHVRRLSPEHITWVQHCMVGDVSRGTVTKTYKA